MKKTYLLLLALITLCLTASAQTIFKTVDEGSFEFGFNLGYNSTTVTSGNITNTSSRSALNLGAYGEYYFSDRWSVKVKLVDDPKGWDNGYITTSSTSYTTDFQLNYLTIPVLANWHFGRKRNWYLNFGPYVGFLLNASETTGGTDVKPYFNTTDVGLDLGIGVKIPISDKAKIFIEDDGEVGFANIFNETSSNGSSVQNSRSSLNLGVMFNLQ